MMLNLKNKQFGGTFFGFLLGLIVGLGVALAVVMMINKKSTLFEDKNKVNTTQKASPTDHGHDNKKNQVKQSKGSVDE
jgi:MFS superfamily sulfate permease-like transporter